ncbi:MAG: FecR domain-containing protein [Verrucomicrobiota bacterium]
MKQVPRIDRELLALFSAAAEDRLDAEKLSKLESKLLSDPTALVQYLRFQQLQALLEVCPPESNSPEIDAAMEGNKLLRFSRSRILRPLAAAAAGVGICLGVLSFLASPSGGKAGSPIATLIMAEACVWELPRDGVVEGSRISPQKLRLSSGTAVIRFDGGAEIALSGDAGVALLSPGSAEIDRGQVVVRAESGADGFRLGTPAGDLIDLGTEFAVRVTEEGSTELHVHEGEVASGDEVVSAGHALRWASGEGKNFARGGKPTVIDAPRFRDLVKRANPRERPDLMRVYEGFHVGAGTYDPAEFDGGKGWAGSWRLRRPEERGRHNADTSEEMVIDHGAMEVTWPVRGGRLGMLQFPAGRNIRVREMAQPIDFGRDGITYFSFLAAEAAEVVKPEAGKPSEADPGEAWKRKHDFRFTFRSSEDYFGESLSFGWSEKRRPRIQAGFAASHQAIRRLPAGETVFLVGKIIHSEHQPDQVFFRFYRVDEPLDFAEPAEWDVEARDFDLDSELNLLLLTAEGATVRFVDEIRIGPSWRSVTPIDRKIRSNSEDNS